MNAVVNRLLDKKDPERGLFLLLLNNNCGGPAGMIKNIFFRRFCNT